MIYKKGKCVQCGSEIKDKRRLRCDDCDYIVLDVGVGTRCDQKK